jgi:signal transduction histidine kinase
MSRIESGRLELKKREFDMVKLAEIVVEKLKSQSSRHVLVLSSRCREATVYADPDKIEQVLVNLLDNAVKYSQPHEIRIRLDRSDGYVRLSVQDQGVGIPREHLPYIFRSFYRIESGLTQRASGSGLGLAVVQHIVRAHRGRIEVESEPGRGSTFTLLLPITQSQSKAQELP